MIHGVSKNSSSNEALTGFQKFHVILIRFRERFWEVWISNDFLSIEPFGKYQAKELLSRKFVINMYLYLYTSWKFTSLKIRLKNLKLLEDNVTRVNIYV